MSTYIPASADDLKNYIKAKLGDDIINIEMSDNQYEIVINDGLQKFFNYTFDGYEEVFIPVTLTYGSSFLYLDDDILNVIDVYGGKTFLNNIISMSVYNAENLYFNRNYTFNFARMSHKLIINETFEQDKNLMVHVYKKLSEVSFTDIYNHPWLKKYTVALAKQQWGQNLIKFNNVVLPGEMQLNGAGILEEGKRELIECEEELSKNWAFFPLPQVI